MKTFTRAVMAGHMARDGMARIISAKQQVVCLEINPYSRDKNKIEPFSKAKTMPEAAGEQRR